MSSESCILIRRATADDFDGILPLLAQLWPKKTDLHAPELREMFGRLLPVRAYVCAEAEGRIVAFGDVSFEEKFVVNGPAAYVEELVVDEPFRGRGIGRRMMDAMRCIAVERGCKVLVLDSALHRTEAHRFYESYGMDKRCYLFVHPLES